jgi:glycosyltransferase involved in cell wall biosynthesis
MKADYNNPDRISGSAAGVHVLEGIPSGPTPSVTICIPSFKRPVGLRRLLEKIALIEYRGPLKIIVVDNDAALQEGRRVVDELREEFPYPLRALIEERPGHTYAYNLAFRTAVTEPGASDLVAVLDDDEYPSADWLTRLVDVLIRFDAGIAGGPVMPVFEDPGHWIAKTDLFNPLRYPTGPVSAIYGAGNMLVRRDILARYLDEPFANELAFTGGSDISFFYRCRSDGVSFAWADDAIVFETVPVSRMSVSWLLRRAIRAGMDLGRVGRENDKGLRAVSIRLAKGPGLAAVSLARLPIALAYGKARTVRTLMDLGRGVGRIASEFEIRYEEYRSKHGN